MKTISKLFPLLALIALFSACQDHRLEEIIEQKGIPLSGIQEVPFNSSQGTGTADVSYNKTTRRLTYTITFSGLTGNPTAGHIHASAPRGTNASVIIPFSGLPASTSGTINGSAVITAAQETDLLNGLFYFNLHTAAFPGGEIRGQIEFLNQSFMVSKLNIPLSGDQEVPAKMVAGTGNGTVVYNKNTKLLSYSVTYSNLTNLTAGHIHGSAPRGVNASVLIPFSGLPASTSGTINGSAVITAAQETALLNGLFYFNLHTTANPGGEIRGQIEF
jgi:hypothetical protein